jgi:hypothetical protein
MYSRRNDFFVERTPGLPRRDSSRRSWLRLCCAVGQPIVAAAAFQAALRFAHLPTYFVDTPLAAATPAIAIPALDAGRTDPIEALRCE